MVVEVEEDGNSKAAGKQLEANDEAPLPNPKVNRRKRRRAEHELLAPTIKPRYAYTVYPDQSGLECENRKRTYDLERSHYYLTEIMTGYPYGDKKKVFWVLNMINSGKSDSEILEMLPKMRTRYALPPGTAPVDYTDSEIHYAKLYPSSRPFGLK